MNCAPSLAIVRKLQTLTDFEDGVRQRDISVDVEHAPITVSLGQNDYTSHYKPHPFISEHAANSIGLTLDEASGSEMTRDLMLRIGGVYT
ncbi:MAG: hypothetical protein WAM23_01370, partial [Candidatus Acidiferrales bacterium]